MDTNDDKDAYFRALIGTLSYDMLIIAERTVRLLAALEPLDRVPLIGPPLARLAAAALLTVSKFGVCVRQLARRRW